MKTKIVSTMINTTFRSIALRAMLLGTAAALATVATADARTFVGLHFFVPLGPPAYYAPYPQYYAPAYYPPPVYYAPPAVVPQAAPCQRGLWRQDDGSVVRGVACLGPDGNWRLAN
jgi:hypothetical protein